MSARLPGNLDCGNDMYINAIGQIYLLSLKAFTLAVTAPVGPACIKWASDGASKSGGERGIRTLDRVLAYTPLAGVRLQPLGQLSVGDVAHAGVQPQARHNTNNRYGIIVLGVSEDA